MQQLVETGHHGAGRGREAEAKNDQSGDPDAVHAEQRQACRPQRVDDDRTGDQPGCDAVSSRDSHLDLPSRRPPPTRPWQTDTALTFTLRSGGVLTPGDEVLTMPVS